VTNFVSRLPSCVISGNALLLGPLKQRTGALAGPLLWRFSAMNASIRRRWQAPLTVLFCGLVLLTSAERRLAELDFNSPGVVRIENNEKPDGDEIFNRLIFVDDTADPRALAVRDTCHAAPILLEACPRALITVRLSEPRAPPHSLPSYA